MKGQFSAVVLDNKDYRGRHISFCFRYHRVIFLKFGYFQTCMSSVSDSSFLVQPRPIITNYTNFFHSTFCYIWWSSTSLWKAAKVYANPMYLQIDGVLRCDKTNGADQCIRNRRVSNLFRTLFNGCDAKICYVIWFIWHCYHSPVGMAVSDGLVPISQHICNHRC